MSDIALAWNPAIGGFDLALEGGQLVTDDGLMTAIIVSLFTDARASADDVLPEPGSDRRGWWGDMLSPVAAWQMGSKLWLLAREKQVPAVLARARDASRAALGWLIEDGIASSVEVSARFPRQGWLGLVIEIVRPNGPARQKYDFAWNATDRELKVASYEL